MWGNNSKEAISQMISQLDHSGDLDDDIFLTFYTMRQPIRETKKKMFDVICGRSLTFFAGLKVVRSENCVK